MIQQLVRLFVVRARVDAQNVLYRGYERSVLLCHAPLRFEVRLEPRSLKGGLWSCATHCRCTEAPRISPPGGAAFTARLTFRGLATGQRHYPGFQFASYLREHWRRFALFLRRNIGALFNTRKSSLALITVWRVIPSCFAKASCFSSILPLGLVKAENYFCAVDWPDAAHPPAERNRFSSAAPLYVSFVRFILMRHLLSA